MQFRAILLAEDGTVTDTADPATALASMRRQETLTWIDIEGDDPEARSLLEGELGFHPLSVATALDDHTDPPKVVRYEDHLFVLVHGVDYFSESETVDVVELGMFIGNGYLVTCHSLPVDAIEHVREQVREDATHDGRRGADFLAHAVAATLVANIEPTVERLGSAVEQIEAEIVDDPRRVHLDVLNRVKRSALRLARLLQPERVALRRVTDRGEGIISPECVYYFDDVADDVEFMEGLIGATGERATVAFSTYLSVISIRQNEGVRLLSILAFVFLPLTLLAGIYGMNFENMPELGWEYGYFVVLGIIGAALAGMAIWIFLTQRSFRREATMALTRLLVVEPRRVSGYTAALARWPRRVANELGVTREEDQSR